SAQHGTRVVDILQEVLEENYIERSSGEQVCELGGVPVFQHNLLRKSCFPRGAPSAIQHRQRGIQQGDVKAKSRQAQRHDAGAASEIQGAQRPCGLRQKLLQIGEGKVEAQSALRCLKVGGVLIRAALEAFAVGFRGHLLYSLCDTQRGVQERISNGLATTSLSAVSGAFKSVY